MKYFSLMSFPSGVFLIAWSDAVVRYAMDAKYNAAIPAMQLARGGDGAAFRIHAVPVSVRRRSTSRGAFSSARASAARCGCCSMQR